MWQLRELINLVVTRDEFNGWWSGGWGVNTMAKREFVVCLSHSLCLCFSPSLSLALYIVVSRFVGLICPRVDK